ncbi:RNA polymerase sigma factor [Planctomyces sp. SH-PL62]|uniref:RNA polymerase sigma factor n=1 Tax=Planctomyces sp. SH-PL62 TaxID=1636152 RepID=UPI00078BD9B4|nr:sigma-70 family RNA polymerase sigma factor [Planctomyces sp. SH-PL62]AMV37604.1 ECF RNA polymerase sigma-E factor [Planctomyces sp. SH-PL62]
MTSDDSQSLRDEILVLKHRLGDASAFDELMRRWEPRLLYYLRRLTPQEADAWDALQRTWLAAFRDLRRLKDPKALRAWLYRVARNQAASHLRAENARRGRVEDLDPDGLIDDAWTPDPDEAEAVHAALATLSLAHREVVTLHFLEQMPLREIAEVVSAPIGTVKSRLHHARRLLRQALAQSRTP